MANPGVPMSRFAHHFKQAHVESEFISWHVKRRHVGDTLCLCFCTAMPVLSMGLALKKAATSGAITRDIVVLATCSSLLSLAGCLTLQYMDQQVVKRGRNLYFSLLYVLVHFSGSRFSVTTLVTDTASNCRTSLLAHWGMTVFNAFAVPVVFELPYRHYLAAQVVVMVAFLVKVIPGHCRVYLSLFPCAPAAIDLVFAALSTTVSDGLNLQVDVPPSASARQPSLTDGVATTSQGTLESHACGTNSTFVRCVSLKWFSEVVLVGLLVGMTLYCLEQKARAAFLQHFLPEQVTTRGSSDNSDGSTGNSRVGSADLQQLSDDGTRASREAVAASRTNSMVQRWLHGLSFSSDSGVGYEGVTRQTPRVDPELAWVPILLVHLPHLVYALWVAFLFALYLICWNWPSLGLSA